MKHNLLKFLIGALISILPLAASAQRGLPAQTGVQITGGAVDGLLIRNSEGERSFFGSLAITRSNKKNAH